MKILVKYIISLFCFITLIINFSISQESEKLAKLRLAQGYEEAGEWERAVELYESLYNIEPRNYIFIDGLQRSYRQVKEYEKAIEIVRSWLAIQPRDINMTTTLGGLYYDSGKETTADSVWKSVIATDPNNIQLYRIIANEMMEHRLYEQCIQTYIRGRAVSKKETMFADELGTIYTALQQYKSAAQEYMRLVISSPEQLSFTQSRLSSFTSKPEALKDALEVVSAEVKIQPENTSLRRLYVWLLIEDRSYDSALEQYRIVDHLSNANGNELYIFAQRLDREKQYKIAAETYKEIISQNKNQQIIPYARFGYARAREELSEQSDTAAIDFVKTTPLTESLPTYQSVIKLYESITESYKIPDIVSQSFFRIGIIKFEKLFDLDGALTVFNRIREIPQTSNVQLDAVLKIGEAQVAGNNLLEARKEFERLSKIPQVIYQDQAAFKLAEINYFEAKFDSALSILKRFNLKPNTDLANDALQLQYFIQENQNSSPKALTEFTKADLLIRQRKFSEAVAQFQDIVKQYPTALLIDDAIFKIGELHLKLRKSDEAIKSFQFIADSIQLSVLKDRAQFVIAEIYQSIIKNKTLAIESYEKLLTQFPNSLYAEESRKRIRLLRGG